MIPIDQLSLSCKGKGKVLVNRDSVITSLYLIDKSMCDDCPQG